MTSIEWTDAVWNPVVGCSRVSAGCEHCYAERVAHRGLAPQHRGLTVVGKHGPRWTGEVRFLAERLDEPLKWRKPRRVFVNSMSDLFHESLTYRQIADVFAVMARAPVHTFQVLTKRPERARAWFEWLRDAEPSEPSEALATLDDAMWPLPNVWLGVSVEDQATADTRIPLLLGCPAAVRWVSYEPALGPVDFSTWLIDALHRIGRAPRMEVDWVVIGGESGPGARPFDVAWARSTIAQCREAGTPCFVKQAGSQPVVDGVALKLRDRKGGDMAEWPEDLRVREWPVTR